MVGDLGCLWASPAGTCARRRSYFLLRGQKKVTKEKATPTHCALRWRYGNLRCSLQVGSRSNSPAAQTVAGPGPLAAALLGALRGGPRGSESAAQSAPSRLGREPGDAGPDVRSRVHAVWRRRVAQGWADQGWSMFERSELRQTPTRPSNAACRRSRATTSARLFLLTSFGEAKEVSRPPGRIPGLPSLWRQGTAESTPYLEESPTC